MISDLSFNSCDSLGVIRLVSFPDVLIVGPSLLYIIGDSIVIILLRDLKSVTVLLLVARPLALTVSSVAPSYH